MTNREADKLLALIGPLYGTAVCYCPAEERAAYGRNVLTVEEFKELYAKGGRDIFEREGYIEDEGEPDGMAMLFTLVTTDPEDAEEFDPVEEYAEKEQ